MSLTIEDSYSLLILSLADVVHVWMTLGYIQNGIFSVLSSTT